MRTILVSAAMAVLTSFVAMAADLVFVPKDELSNADFDWSKKENYVDAVTDPGEGDIVALPTAFTNKFTSGTSNWTFLSKLKAVHLGAGSELTLEVANSGDKPELELPITASYPNFDSNSSAVLKKTGAGELYLSAFGNYVENAYRDYYSNLKVMGGTLKLTQRCEVANATCQLYSLEIAEGATFYPVNANADATVAARVYTSLLCGAGTIKYDSSVLARLYVQDKTGLHSVFSGKVIGAQLQVYVVFGRLDFTNPENHAFRNVVLDGDAVHGWASPTSTIGWNIVGSGTFKYLGTEPCTYEESAFLAANYNCFDGGDAGGVTFGSGYKWQVTDATKQTLIELKGSNMVNECVVDHMLNAPYAYIRKSEPGIWRFTATGEATQRSTYNNGFAVSEGTLRFDSIAEAGTVCSLGTGTALKEEPTKCGSTDALQSVDYAFKLGSFDSDGNPVEGALELSGTTTADRGFVCNTRPIALKSTGVLRVPAAQTALQFGGVSGLDAGEKKLVLDGDNAYDNVISNVADGAGIVSLEKRGVGKWTVRGDLRIHGDLDVKAGTLVLENTVCGARYTHYRFYVKETAGGTYKRNPTGYYAGLNSDPGYSEGGYRMQIQRLYLYDKDGNVVSKNLSATGCPYMLEPGNCVLSSLNPSTDPSAIPNLFGNSTECAVKFNVLPNVNAPETWGCIEFALPEGSAEVVGYDVLQKRKFDNNYSVRILTAWELHGSADGRQWHKLHSVEDFEASKDSVTWCCDKTWDGGAYLNKRDLTTHPIYTFADGEKTVDDGFKQLDQIRTVSVAKGAKLIAKGKTPEAISGLKIDEAGMGELQNVALTAEGTVELQLSDPGVVTEIETSLNQVATGANVTKWSVKVNGRLRKSVSLDLNEDGTLVYHPAGLMLIFR